MALKKRSGVGFWCGIVVAMHSSRRSEPRQFKSITGSWASCISCSKPKEDIVLALRRVPQRDLRTDDRGSGEYEDTPRRGQIHRGIRIVTGCSWVLPKTTGLAT